MERAAANREKLFLLQNVDETMLTFGIEMMAVASKDGNSDKLNPKSSLSKLSKAETDAEETI